MTVLASTPISGYRAGVAGAVVLSSPIDLSAIRRALTDHAAAASLTGLGPEIVLVAGRGDAAGAALKIPVPLVGVTGAGDATLIATPKRATGLTWARPARVMSGGLAALLLAGFVVGFVRRSRS